MSLGTTGSSDGTDTVSQAVNRAVDAGIIAVIAAGNSGPARYTVGAPGAAEKAITMGAAQSRRIGCVSEPPQGQSIGQKPGAAQRLYLTTTACEMYTLGSMQSTWFGSILRPDERFVIYFTCHPIM